MIRKNKKKIIITSLITLLPLFAGLLLGLFLPEEMSLQWSPDSGIQGWKSTGFVTFVFPVIILMFHWLSIFICSKDPGNNLQSHQMVSLVYWICPTISILASLISYCSAFDSYYRTDRFLRAGLGLMFMIIGNFLPKCRPNHTIGIRLPWTLYNEENWNKTHKLGGKLWFIGGFLMILSAFLPKKGSQILMAAVFVIIIALPALYSFLYSRKQKKLGTYTPNTDDTASRDAKKNAKILKFSSIFCAACFIIVGIMLFTGDIKMQYNDSSFTINATYYPDMTVSYSTIKDLELRNEKVDGYRSNGWGSPRLLMGSFQNDEFGGYTRYTYTNCKASLILDLDGRILVISGKDEAATQAIYDELKERTGL